MPPAVPSEIIERACEYGADLTGEQGGTMGRFLDLLLSANRDFNLTAIEELDEAWERHVLDSLSLLPELAGVVKGSRVIDVGSGGGLPAIPLAVARPELSFTLLEATGKKAQFLSTTARELGLSNVDVVCERAESFGQGRGRASYEVATARAVSRLPVLLELTLPLLKPGGYLLAIKGEQAEQEVGESPTALSILKGQLRFLRRTSTGAIVRVEKIGETPRHYPRRPGEPKRNPLR